MTRIFETERLYIYPYSVEDFDDFFRLNGDEDIMRYIRPVKSREDTKLFFEQVLDDYITKPGLGRWGMRLKEDNRFVGSFAVIPVQQSRDIQLGYALLKDAWGRGYASEAVRGGINYVFDQLKLSSVAAITEAANEASQKVLLRNGFLFEKTFDEGEKKLFLYRLLPAVSV